MPKKPKTSYDPTNQPLRDRNGKIVKKGEPFVDIHGVFHPNSDNYHPADYSDWYIYRPPLDLSNPYARPADTDYKMDYPPEVLEANGPYENQFDDLIDLERLGQRTLTRELNGFEIGAGLGVATIAGLLAVPSGGASLLGAAELITAAGWFGGAWAVSGLSSAGLEMTINDAPTRKYNKDLTISQEYPDLVSWLLNPKEKPDRLNTWRKPTEVSSPLLETLDTASMWTNRSQLGPGLDPPGAPESARMGPGEMTIGTWLRSLESRGSK